MTVFFFITSIMKSNLDVEPMTFMFHDNWSITNPLHLLPYHRLGLSVSYSQHFSSQYLLSLIFPKIFSSNFEKVLARLMNQSTFHIYFWGVNRKKEAVVFFYLQAWTQAMMLRTHAVSDRDINCEAKQRDGKFMSRVEITQEDLSLKRNAINVHFFICLQVRRRENRTYIPLLLFLCRMESEIASSA